MRQAVERANHVPDTLKPRNTLPVSSALSSGSNEEVGLQASQPQNMGVACGCLTEGSNFLERLKHELGDKKSICTELHKRFKWKRQTIDSTRSFEMHHPHTGVSGNVHVEEVAEFPLGVRSRMLFLMLDSSQVSEACFHNANVQLNTDVVPLVEQSSIIFIAIWKADLPAFRNSDVFTRRKDYPYRPHSLTPRAARDIFQEHFDFHASAQEESYLVNHEVAKTHGKGNASMLVSLLILAISSRHV